MQLTNDILNLSAEKKVELIGEIWDSIDANSFQINEAQEQELDYRLEKVLKNETNLVTWDEIKEKLKHFKK